MNPLIWAILVSSGGALLVSFLPLVRVLFPDVSDSRTTRQRASDWALWWFWLWTHDPMIQGMNGDYPKRWWSPRAFGEWRRS